MAFPNTLTAALDGVTEIEAAHLNNLEEKVGIDNSLDPASLDYMLRNTSSVDPGHKHTAGAFSGGINGDVFFRDADSIWKPGSPDTANLVAKTGGQTIAGVKTFTEIPILPASDPTADNEATRKSYVNAQDALKVSKAGDTMSGNLAMGGNDITGVGTLEADVVELTTPLAGIYGGTGLAAITPGDILYGDACSNTLIALAKAVANNVLLSGDAPSWGKVGLTTHVDGVLPVANGGTGGADAWTAAQDPGHKHSKLWASDGDPEAVTVDAAGNVMVGASAVGDSAAKVVGVGNGTDPLTSPADMFQMWSKDQAAGNACPHFLTENGAVIKLYKEAALTAGLTQITHTEPGTPDYAVADLTQTTPWGFASQDEGNSVLKVIKNLQVRVDELEDKLQALGFLN